MCIIVEYRDYSSGSDSFWEPGNYKRTTKWVHYNHFKNWFCKTRIKTTKWVHNGHLKIWFGQLQNFKILTLSKERCMPIHICLIEHCGWFGHCCYVLLHWVNTIDPKHGPTFTILRADWWSNILAIFNSAISESISHTSTVIILTTPLWSSVIIQRVLRFVVSVSMFSDVTDFNP